MKWSKALLAGLTGLAQGVTAERQEQYRRQQEQAAQQWQAAQIRDQQNYRQAMLNQDALRAQEERRRQEDAQQHAIDMLRLQDTQQRGILDYTQDLNQRADTQSYNTGRQRATEVAQGVNAQLLPLYGNLMYGPQGMQTGTQLGFREQMVPRGIPQGTPPAEMMDRGVRQGADEMVSQGLNEVETPVMTPVGALDWNNPLVMEQFGADYLQAGGKMQLDEYGNIMYTGQPQTPEQRAAAAQAMHIDTQTKLATMEKALAEAHTAAVEAENADEMAAYDLLQEQLEAARAEYELAVDSGEFGLAAQAKAKIDRLYAGVAEAQSRIAHTQWAEVNPSPNVIAQGEYALQGQREGRAYDWQKTTMRRTWEVEDAETLRLQEQQKAAAAGGTPDKAMARKTTAVSKAYGQIADIVEDPDLSEDAKQKKIAMVYKAAAVEFTDRSHPLLQELAEAAGIGPVGGAAPQRMSNGWTVDPVGAKFFETVQGRPASERDNKCGRWAAVMAQAAGIDVPVMDANKYNEFFNAHPDQWVEIPVGDADTGDWLQWDGGKERGFGGNNKQHIGIIATAPDGSYHVVSNNDYRLQSRDVQRAKAYRYIGPGGGRQPSAAAPQASAPAMPQRPAVDIGIASSGSARRSQLGAFSGAVAGGTARGKSPEEREKARRQAVARERLQRARGMK